MRGEKTMSIAKPENWDLIIKFAESDRSSYTKIQEARPDQKTALEAMADFIENCKHRNCTPQQSYIESLRLK